MTMVQFDSWDEFVLAAHAVVGSAKPDPAKTDQAQNNVHIYYMDKGSPAHSFFVQLLEDNQHDAVNILNRILIRKIEQIKLIRAITGWNIKRVKDWVEDK